MPREERDVRIVSWPEVPAKLEHRFNPEKPCPVTIHFEEPPAHLVVHGSPKDPLNVDMNMNVVARETIPVCVKLCDPICARSDYSIGIEIFDRPVGRITLRGLTRLFNCREEEPIELTCAEFRQLKPGMEFDKPLTNDGIKFSSLGGPLRTVTFGDPQGQVKLVFPQAGIRIDFPHPVSNARITVSNYGDPALKFRVYAGGAVVQELTEDVHNEVKVVAINQPGMTGVEIRGGKNEATVIAVCYYPPKPEQREIKKAVKTRQ